MITRRCLISWRKVFRMPSFAFLSARRTDVSDEEMLDEVIHLAAGLQFSGSKNVTGTLLKDGGVMDYTKAAWALNHATRSNDEGATRAEDDLHSYWSARKLHTSERYGSVYHFQFEVPMGAPAVVGSSNLTEDDLKAKDGKVPSFSWLSESLCP
ncbi:hypothetical protein BDR07DRAFT_1605923 [Suillus spraguei]|nr:hypothetical protein BDR07DRAFT_1605923 [Suillus spraguei]